MKSIQDMEFYPPAEKLVEILRSKTQNENANFFRILVSYYLTKVASMMRCNIHTHDRGDIPVSMYAINLAPSGYGKGHSTNIIEDSVIHLFKQKFLEETFEIVSEKNLAVLAQKRAIKYSRDEQNELVRVTKEFEQLGALAFSFDSGTTAAVKQMRHKLLMANIGSMNLEIDEIGSNLLGNVDVLTTFLELFDVGKVKQKLTKNTNENTRNEEIDGRTPTNMMLYGTPSKVFTGGKVEEEYISMLDTGYARRCIFGFAKDSVKTTQLTPQELYDRMTDTSLETYLVTFADQLAALADHSNYNRTLAMTKDVSLVVIEYKLMCEKLADQLGEHEDIRKAELTHRYFKALKLAGTYAFIDGSHEVTEDHFYNAVKLVEESGIAFSKMFTRERNYVKLAKYIATIGREVTHVDLVEDLPFYKGSEAQKRELMTLAIAYGYKNNIIIKKQYNDGIEFMKGESLKETDIDKMVISYSTDIVSGYRAEEVPFDQLSKLTQLPNYHWVSHHLIDGYRREENCIANFNMVVFDVDGKGVTIDAVRSLLSDYTYHIYTTKRHTNADHRFRIVMPISHHLKLDAATYKQFINNIYEWLPFEVDTATNQRARKWLTNTGDFYDNQGKLLDALIFIPETSKNDERRQIMLDQHALSNLERWFINNTGAGNRSNQLIKYALMLVDANNDFASIQARVLSLNSKIPDKLEENEILSTIMVTVSRELAKRHP